MREIPSASIISPRSRGGQVYERQVSVVDTREILRWWMGILSEQGVFYKILPSILTSCNQSSLAVGFWPLSSPLFANLRISPPLYFPPRESYSSSSIPGSRSNSSSPYCASVHQIDPLNHERAISPTTRLPTSSIGDFLDFSTHLDRHSTPISDGGCHPKCGSTGPIGQSRKCGVNVA